VCARARARASDDLVLLAKEQMAQKGMNDKLN
jgi:hypothetical protein